MTLDRKRSGEIVVKKLDKDSAQNKLQEIVQITSNISTKNDSQAGPFGFEHSQENLSISDDRSLEGRTPTALSTKESVFLKGGVTKSLKQDKSQQLFKPGLGLAKDIKPNAQLKQSQAKGFKSVKGPHQKMQNSPPKIARSKQSPKKTFDQRKESEQIFLKTQISPRRQPPRPKSPMVMDAYKSSRSPVHKKAENLKNFKFGGSVGFRSNSRNSNLSAQSKTSLASLNAQIKREQATYSNDRKPVMWENQIRTNQRLFKPVNQILSAKGQSIAHKMRSPNLRESMDVQKGHKQAVLSFKQNPDIQNKKVYNRMYYNKSPQNEIFREYNDNVEDPKPSTQDLRSIQMAIRGLHLRGKELSLAQLGHNCNGNAQKEVTGVFYGKEYGKYQTNAFGKAPRWQEGTGKAPASRNSVNHRTMFYQSQVTL